MGTRHLIAVQLDGQYKIAQYGQWDGYPSGQGLGALSFLRTMDRAQFAEKVRASTFITDVDVAQINADLKADGNLLGEGKKYQQFSRDRGSDILGIVANAEPGIKLRDSIDFAGDSLFCEFAYVVDLDAKTFEVFKGFNKTELPDTERFSKLKPDTDGYYHVKHMKTYQLDALPTDEQFMDDCGPKDED